MSYHQDELPGAARETRHARYWLLAIVGLAALLRLIGLAHFSLWYDEGASLYLGQYLSEPAALFNSAKNTEPPLNALLTGAWARVVALVSPTGPTDVANDFLLRLLPWAFGVLNCALVYFVTFRLYRCLWTARCAAFLFALSPFQIYYAQELRVYGPYIALALLALWSMLDALEKNRPASWVGYVACSAALMYTHYIAMWLIFTFNVAFVLLLWKHKAHLWRWTAANAVVMVLIAPALYRAFAMHAEVQDLAIPWYPNPTWKTGLITFKTFFAGYGPTAWAYWPLFLLALVLWAIGIIASRKNRSAALVIACLTWVPIVGCVWVWGRADFSFYEHRLFIFSGVAALVGLSRGIVRTKRIGLAALAAMVVLSLPCLADYYQGKLHPVLTHRIAIWDKVDFRGAAQALTAKWQPGDRLVYTSHFGAYSMYHYFPRDQVRLGWGLEDEAVFITLMGHEALLREHRLMPVPKEAGIAGAKRVWLLTTSGVTFEWHEVTERIRAWLASEMSEGETIHFDGVTLTCFAHSFPPEAP